MHTPASVHDGSWAHVQAHRAATLRAAYQAHPDRFRGRCPQLKALPAKVWINEPPATIETTTSPQTTRAA
jgi:putative transposase